MIFKILRVLYVIILLWGTPLLYVIILLLTS